MWNKKRVTELEWALSHIIKRVNEEAVRLKQCQKDGTLTEKQLKLQLDRQNETLVMTIKLLSFVIDELRVTSSRISEQDAYLAEVESRWVASEKKFTLKCDQLLFKVERLSASGEIDIGTTSKIESDNSTVH